MKKKVVYFALSLVIYLTNGIISRRPFEQHSGSKKGMDLIYLYLWR